VVGVNLQSENREREREREREKRVEHNGSGPFFFGSLDFRVSRPQRLPPGSKKKKEVVPISIGSDQRRRTRWGAF
jgi:hypothetical protein